MSPMPSIPLPLPDIVDLPVLPDYLDYWAEVRPDDVAVFTASDVRTWRQLRDDVYVLAKALMASGVERGSRVAVLSNQSIEATTLFLALTMIGGVFVGINTRFKLRDMAYVIDDAEVEALFAIGSFEGRSFAEEIDGLTALPTVRETVVLDGSLDADESLEKYRARHAGVSDDALLQRRASLRSDDPFLVVYTSGSTGRPKGVLMPQRGLVQNMKASVRRTRRLSTFPTGFRAQTDHPLDHIGGIDRQVATLLLGGQLLLQERFDPEGILEAIQAHKITYWFGEATQLLRALPLIESYDLSSVEVVLFVGALPRDVLARLSEVGDLCTGYGMSETCNVVIRAPGDMTIDDYAQGYLGEPIDTMMVRVAGDEGQRLDPGNVGELQVRSANLFLTYLNRPDAVSAAFTSDGWFRTGDLMVESEAGLFRLIGRADETYKSGGYNVHPSEVEAVLLGHPAVRQAVVVSAPDPEYQLVGHARVVTLADQSVTAADLDRWCREHMPNYRVPKRLTIVDALPLLRNGKVDRKAVQKEERADATAPAHARKESTDD